MDVMQTLWQGLVLACTVQNLAWALAGCVLGTVMGVLPGFGASAAMALLLPMTFHVDVTQAFVFFIAVACGGMYGGSTTSILLNSVGEASRAVTAMEGHRMALNGRAGVALATAAVGSLIAGTLAALFVVVAAPWVADIASKLGPAEIFMLMAMALGAVSVAIGKSTLRGVTALGVGIALACMGHETWGGAERLTAGLPLLYDGLDMVLVAVGLLVVAQVLHAAMFEGPLRYTLNTVGPVRLSREDGKRSWRPWIRGTAIGIPFGCLPVGGVDMPTYVSYASERYMVSPERRQEFGREGAIEGVAGPQAASTATVTAALVPLLTMGIPTSNTTAVMLSAFQNYGLQPGPQWLSNGYGLVWVWIGALFLIHLMLWVLNMPLVRMWVPLLRIPRPHVYAIMLVFATAGVYSMRQSVGDLCLLYGFGLLGVAMRRFDFPVTPLVIGVALGPLAEVQLRQALAVGNGSWMIFIERPLALTLLLLVLALIVVPRLLKGWVHRRMAQVRGPM